MGQKNSHTESTSPRGIEFARGSSNLEAPTFDPVRMEAETRRMAIKKGSKVIEKAKSNDKSISDQDFDRVYTKQHVEMIPDSKNVYWADYASTNGWIYCNNTIDLQKKTVTLAENNTKGSGIPNSEVIYRQCHKVAQKMGLNKFEITKMIGKNVNNEETIQSMSPFLTKDKTKFKRGDDGFIAAIGTPACKGKYFLTEQHPDLFGNRKLSSITFEKNGSGRITQITYELKK
ncbi:MAG TPA: hypothetical protein VL461_10870 [Dictyobacter sp.]|jgi:hypothetical protein|nr:hypothetical protein [Dictyobacter sp.]